MALFRVPGSRTYFADDTGFKKILADPKVGAVALSAAGDLARAAGTNYVAAPATVPGGWANQLRAGAVVREVSPDARDARRRVLRLAAEGMGRRSL